MLAETPAALAPHLTPHGHLLPVPDAAAPVLAAAVQQRLTQAFAPGAGHGLLQLGAGEIATALPAAWAFWRDFAARYVTAVCAAAGAAGTQAPHAAPDFVIEPPWDDFPARIADAPPMTGAEYLTAEVLGSLWADLGAAFQAELAAAKLPLQDFLKARHPA